MLHFSHECVHFSKKHLVGGVRFQFHPSY
jgi:hypothetical protein